MTSHAIPAFPNPVPYAVLPSNSPALLAPHNPLTHSAIQTAISPGALRNCIRLRGMPYSATIDDIVSFLGDYSLYILPSGVHIVLNQQGRPSGDAFIQLASVEKASQAGLDVSKGGCHKKHMGERYVEVFQCSGDEMNMVLMGGTLNRNGIAPPPGMTLVSADTTPSGLIQASPISNQPASISSPIIFQTPPGSLVLQHPIVASSGVSSFQPLDFIQTQALLSASRATIFPQPTFLPFPQYLPTPPVSPNNLPTAISIGSLPGLPSVSTSALISPEENGSIRSTRIQIRMQNIPFNVTVSDILEFFKGFKLEHSSVKMLYNDKLHPTGEALVTFHSLLDAHRALVERNRKALGNRLVELVLLS